MSESNHISTEEQSYHEWVKQNLHYLHINKQHISVMQKVYIDGFIAGSLYRSKIKTEEYLQK